MDPSTSLPLPHDIPLPLPLDQFMLETAVVLLFLAHILFVNIMVGASTLTLVYEIVGLRKEKYDALARAWAATITVNKSLAVVLGVAPLLVVNVLYTVHFYTANSLTGSAWIMIIPLIVAAFLLGYLHYYTWDRLSQSKGLHIFIGAVATAIFWLVPLIFLANINLMLFPERWTEVRGFVSAVTMQNVLPRYLHFILASLAVTGLFGAAWFGRTGFDVETRLPVFDRPKLRRRCYEITFGATLMQFLVGTLVYFTLPAQGVSFFMTGVVLLGVVFAVVALWMMWGEVVAPAARIGRRFAPIVIVLSATVTCMAMGGTCTGENRLPRTGN
jgi:cytochrome c